MFEQVGPPPLDNRVKSLLIAWCILIPVWMALTLAAGAFRSKLCGYLFLVAWGLYPILLWIAFLFKRSKPYLALLLAVSFATMIISSELDELLRHI
jgi:hypothetical protein